MKKIKYFVLSVLLLTFSCKDFTENLNTDPNNFSSAAPELIIGQAQLAWMQLAESNGARYAGIFMNQFTGEDRQYLTVNAYSITAGEFDDLWDDAYVEGIAQAQLTKKLALDNGNLQLAGVAQIVEAALFGEMAALFGDIPFNEAADADTFFAPTYDSQASVFTGVQSLLDNAITNVGSAPSSLYAGNRISSSATWAQIAHSLKARYYLIAKDYPNALTSARNGIQAASGSLVTLHGTSAENRNLYYQFMVDEREGYLGSTGSYLENLIDLTNTSVQRVINTPGEAQRHAFYFTSPGPGLTAPNTSATGVFGQTQSFPLISYEEVKLIEAEAANRTNAGGDDTAFNAVRSYLANKYSGSFPATASAPSSAALLNEIIEEKYISLIGQLQPYHDIRRTNNILGVPAKTGNMIPQRFLYPQVEVDNNPNTPSPLPGLFDKTPSNQ